MPRFILPTSTVAILRQARMGNRLGIGLASVAARALYTGIDASDDGSIVEFSLDCGEIGALQHLVDAAVSEWENGDLNGGSEVYEALEAGRETLNAALDEAHEGEIEGRIAERDHERAYGDDTPSHDAWQRNDFGEYLGIH